MDAYRFYHQNGRVKWRELTGADEQAVLGTDTQNAIRILARLLVDVTGQPLSELKIAQLPTADRDRLLANLYVREFGDSVNASPRCTACDQPFDLDFSIAQLLATMGREHKVAESRWVELVDKDQPTVFVLKTGDRVRLVTGEDEHSLASLDTESAKKALLKACVLSRSSSLSDDELLAVLAQLAPVMDQSIDTHCAECGAAQRIPFSMQRFGLTALRQRQAQVLRDIHLLAYGYKWSMTDILSLPRSQRTALAHMIMEGQV